MNGCEQVYLIAKRQDELKLEWMNGCEQVYLIAKWQDKLKMAEY